ncbi:MAG: PLP-dependent aminotransferase family protein [Proteobacteria bacterium]|nr:PLP-dependent aminotransferase family protein [Pseudomonadota bacterium]
MEPLFELPLRLPTRGSHQVLRALHQQLRAAIVDGRLQPGLRLPSTRALASTHGVSRNTAVAAYDLLLSEGYVSIKRGSGCYVAEVLSRRGAAKVAVGKSPGGKSAEGNPTAPPPTAGAPRVGTDPRVHSFWRNRQARRAAPVPDSLRYRFRCGLPDTSTFPYDIWRRLSNRAMRSLTHPDVSRDPQGLPALREAIAKHVSVSRAVACRPDDVLVTSGAQQAFDLLARVLASGRQTLVAVENPSYPPMRAVFEAVGAKLAPVPVDNDGMLVDQLPSQARIVCVTPSHQFPLGSAMSMPRRMALLEFARKNAAVVIEDDYDCEFRYDGRPLEALQTIDRHESVFYVGTFSKTMFPEVRLGFIVAPPWALEALIAAKQDADLISPFINQHALAAFIAEGHLARHIRKMRSVYSQRRRRLIEGLQRDFSHWLTPVPSFAGLHVAALLPGDAEEIVERARELGVGIGAVGRYCLGKPIQGLVFGYGVISERSIVDGLARLRQLR